MATIAARNEPFTRALGLSVLLHGLVMVLAAAPFVREALAAWQASAAAPVLLAAEPLPEEVEVMVPAVTVVPPPAPPQTFIHTDGLAQATPSSPTTRFISDRDTRAASDLPPDAQGERDVPTQAGIHIPMVEIIRTPLSEGEGQEHPPSPDLVAEPTPPPPPPEAVAEDSPLATPAASPPPPPPQDLERIATTREGDFPVRSTEVPRNPTKTEASRHTTSSNPDATLPRLRESAPELREAAAAQSSTKRPPPPPAVTRPAGFSGLHEPTRQHGTITNRGPASVDAADTPVGRYMKEVTSAISREWHRKRRHHADFVTYGTIKLEFTVNRQGQVQALTIKNRNGANAVMQDFTLNAVLDAKIPPMPPGLPEIFDHDRLPISYDIIVY